MVTTGFSGLAWLAATIVAACSSSNTPSTPPGEKDASIDAGAEDAASDAPPEGDGPVTMFGQPCTVGADAACGEGLFCLRGPSGGTTGFCTKTCPKTSSSACTDVPEGTAAYCLVTDVNAKREKGCAFVCHVGGKTYPCPGELECQDTEEPAGSGQRLCLP